MNHERGAQYTLSHRFLAQAARRKPRVARVLALGVVLLAAISSADPLPPSATYRPLPSVPPDVARQNDEAIKPEVMQRQQHLLNERYDLSNRPMPGVMMSGGRKAVQDGVRVKLRPGTSWEELAQMTPDEIKAKGLLPHGFMPLPHPKQSAGGQVFPQRQIDEIQRAEQRVVYAKRAANPDRLKTRYDQPIYHLSERADDAIRPGFLSVCVCVPHPPVSPVLPVLARRQDPSSCTEDAETQT
jgi:cytochrome c peroxidase